MIDSPTSILFIGNLIGKRQGFQIEWITIFILFFTNIIQKKKHMNLMESYLLIYPSFHLTVDGDFKKKYLNSNNSKTKHGEPFFFNISIVVFLFYINIK